MLRADTYRDGDGGRGGDLAGSRGSLLISRSRFDLVSEAERVTHVDKEGEQRLPVPAGGFCHAASTTTVTTRKTTTTTPPRVRAMLRLEVAGVDFTCEDRNRKSKQNQGKSGASQPGTGRQRGLEGLVVTWHRERSFFRAHLLRDDESYETTSLPHLHFTSRAGVEPGANVCLGFLVYQGDLVLMVPARGLRLRITFTPTATGDDAVARGALEQRMGSGWHVLADILGSCAVGITAQIIPRTPLIDDDDDDDRKGNQQRLRSRDQMMWLSDPLPASSRLLDWRYLDARRLPLVWGALWHAVAAAVTNRTQRSGGREGGTVQAHSLKKGVIKSSSLLWALWREMDRLRGFEVRGRGRDCGTRPLFPPSLKNHRGTVVVTLQLAIHTPEEGVVDGEIRLGG